MIISDRTAPLPSISIAMATFNGSRFLTKQLETLGQQTLLPAELVISDDNSDDNTIVMAEAFAKIAPFPVHIRKNAIRAGYRTNFMNAASMCTSELIAFCDQDDVWHPEKLSEIVGYFADSSVLLIHHNARIVDKDELAVGGLLQPGEHVTVSDPLTVDPWFFALGFCQVFRRSLLDFSSLREQSIDFYFPNEKLAHDQWCFFLATVLGRVIYLPQTLVDYRQHAGNTYGTSGNRLSRLLTKLRQKLNNSGSFYEHLANVAGNRAMILDAIAVMKPDVRRHIVAGSHQYRALAEQLRQRAGIYRQSGIVGRLSKWLLLLRGDVYKTATPWSFDRKSAVRDAILGVLLGPTIERLHRRPESGDAVTVASDGRKTKAHGPYADQNTGSERRGAA